MTGKIRMDRRLVVKVLSQFSAGEIRKVAKELLAIAREKCERNPHGAATRRAVRITPSRN